MQKLRVIIGLAAAVASGSCKLPAPPPPAAEFLVSAGDQTYWVQSDQSGLRVRGSPLILARTGQHYYEIYVEEVNRSFPDALFTGERIFRRDLATGDSTMIYDDTLVVALAASYRKEHPYARMLNPEEDPDEDVGLTAVGETDILNVLGPYLALEHRVFVDHPDRQQDDTTRAVIDVRNGKIVELTKVMSDPAVQEAAGKGNINSRKWGHVKYDIVSRYDSARHSNVLLLKDRRGREWRLGLVGSNYIQIFWLDKPGVDARTRQSLSRAFNEATAYGQQIQMVSRKRAVKRVTPTRASSI